LVLEHGKWKAQSVKMKARGELPKTDNIDDDNTTNFMHVLAGRFSYPSFTLPSPFLLFAENGQIFTLLPSPFIFCRFLHLPSEG